MSFFLGLHLKIDGPSQYLSCVHRIASNGVFSGYMLLYRGHAGRLNLWIQQIV